MKAFKIKPIHPKVNLHYQFHFLKKIKNFEFEGSFPLKGNNNGCRTDIQ